MIQPDGEIEEVEGPTDRSCGDCRLCCKLLLVEAPDEDFLKPQGKWCEHACDSGCGIYDRKPKPCAKFVCAWLNGAFSERDRPDRSHLVVCLEDGIGDDLRDGNGKVIASDVPVWSVYEAWAGVAQKPRAQQILSELERMTVRKRAAPDQWLGPFPICLIPSATGLRRMKMAGSTRWIPCLRPHESEAQFGLDRVPIQSRNARKNGIVSA